MSDKDRIKELESALEQSKRVITSQQETLKELTSPPLRYALVINPDSDVKLPSGDNTMTISTDNGDMKEVFRDEDCKEGDVVLIHPMTSQVVCKASMPDGNMIVSVKRILSDTKCEVTIASEPVIVFTGNNKLQEGDRVILNERFRAITGKMPAEEGFDITKEQEISWDDIGGLTDVKGIMRDIIEMPYKHPEIYLYYKKHTPKGILLYGPPGCGKTMVGKAVATSVKKTHNLKGNGGFIYIKGPEILNKYVGESEGQIRHIFAEARRFKQKTKAPAVIFIDEAESILNRRGSGRSSDVDRTIVPMFLSEMDGMNEQSTIVILATNKENSLDPAVVREGRIDYKVKINRPDVDTAADIFLLYLRNIPTNGHSSSELAEFAAKYLFSTELPLFRLLEGKKEHFFCLHNIASGAMIAHIVNQATTAALHRDLKAGKRSGLLKEDLTYSIDQSYKQNAGLDHKEYLEEYQHEHEIVGAKAERVKLD